MKYSKRKTVLITAGMLSLVYIIAFWFNYLSMYIFSSNILLILSSYFIETFSVLIPPCTALVLLLTYSELGIRSAALHGLLYALTSIFYELPSSAFKYAYQGYEILDTLTLSLLEALLSFSSLLAIYLLLFSVMLIVVKQTAKAKKDKQPDIKNELRASKPFDLSAPLTLGVLSATGLVFAFNFIRELTDTVKFLLSYSENFTASEIFSIMFRYVFILAVLLLSQIAAFSVKKLLTKEE